MVQRIGGNRRKTRFKLQKTNRTRTKVSLTKYFQIFDNGQKVLLYAEPSIHKGMYFPRFHGKVGKVSGKQGACYYVTIKDESKEKKLLVHPVHLRKVE